MSGMPWFYWLLPLPRWLRIRGAWPTPDTRFTLKQRRHFGCLTRTETISLRISWNRQAGMQLARSGITGICTPVPSLPAIFMKGDGFVIRGFQTAGWYCSAGYLPRRETLLNCGHNFVAEIITVKLFCALVRSHKSACSTAKCKQFIFFCKTLAALILSRLAL